MTLYAPKFELTAQKPPRNPRGQRNAHKTALYLRDYWTARRQYEARRNQPVQIALF